MDKREKALRLMSELRESRPRPLLERLDKGEKGTHFVLAYLDHNRDHKVSASELARELGVSTARISVLLRKMEERGLIRKSSSKKDARRVELNLTKKGQKLHEEDQEKMIQAHMRILDDVSDEDLKTFIKISGKIKKTMKDVFMDEGGKDEDI